MPRKLTAKNVRKYAKAHDLQVVYGVHQFLEWFSVSRKLERILWAILKGIELGKQSAAEELYEKKAGKSREKATKRGKETVPDVDELPPLAIVVGLCPKCGSPLRGEPVPHCESKVSSRVFYKECGACPYYFEVFKKGNNYLEIEGGE